MDWEGELIHVSFDLKLQQQWRLINFSFRRRFLQPIGWGNQGYSDVGDKKAWEKTSQALREGQNEVKAKLATEKETDQGKEALAKYAQVIQDESFLTYARDTLESQYDDSGLSLVCRERCSCRTINI